jgi:archaellum component FlaG (FlaF/FlaG flagellin family)
VELMDLTMSSEDLPKVLQIMSSNSEVNMINNMMINGTVKNTGAETATYTRVYATIYDGPSGTGNVVAVTSCTAQPYNLDPGQTGKFEMGFFITQGKTYASYVLAAESDQYAATTEYIAATIPEFPSLIILSLLIVATLVVAVASKRKRPELPIST